MTPRLAILTAAAAAVALVLAGVGQQVYALVWILFSCIALLSIADEGGHMAKTSLTAVLGAVGLFIYASKFGIAPAPEGEGILDYLGGLAHAIHFDIFVFLAGLYLVVNTFAYSGIIGDIAWNIVKRTKGKLGHILVAIMLLTCLLSGIFDGATITTIMGIVTLTILLSSGMKVKDIVKVMILLVVATNIGGVWFVLGEPTNILAAGKLDLSPFYFLAYALPFALPAAALCAFVAWRIARKYHDIRPDRPEIEVLLEGISLRRTHAGVGSLGDTLVALGAVELRAIREMRRLIDEDGLPDFEAALKAGISNRRVYEALSINLNSEELARGLVEFYVLRQAADPMAEILIGDLMFHLHEEYRSRLRSRQLVLASGALLIALLGVHAFVHGFPTWASTIAAGLVAIAAVQKNARARIIRQSWHNLVEAFFLVAIFATITEINLSGAFEAAGKTLLSLGAPTTSGAGILVGSAIFSAVADNIAVMDVITNLIVHHPDWSFFALAAIVGTALGGFGTPIASVQAIIMAMLLRRVAQVSFGQWLRIALPWMLILVAVSILLLLAMYALGLPPRAPLPNS
jgi:Na+/H+ antiporter NhaD/arsenite permease-like protein